MSENTISAAEESLKILHDLGMSDEEILALQFRRQEEVKEWIARVPTATQNERDRVFSSVAVSKKICFYADGRSIPPFELAPRLHDAYRESEVNEYIIYVPPDLSNGSMLKGMPGIPHDWIEQNFKDNDLLSGYWSVLLNLPGFEDDHDPARFIDKRYNGWSPCDVRLWCHLTAYLKMGDGPSWVRYAHQYVSAIKSSLRRNNQNTVCHAERYIPSSY